MNKNISLLISSTEEGIFIDFGDKISNYRTVIVESGMILPDPLKLTREIIKEIQYEIKDPYSKDLFEEPSQYFNLSMMSFQIGPLGTRIANAILEIVGIESITLSPYRIIAYPATLFNKKRNDIIINFSKTISRAIKQYHLDYSKKQKKIERKRKQFQKVRRKSSQERIKVLSSQLENIPCHLQQTKTARKKSPQKRNE